MPMSKQQRSCPLLYSLLEGNPPDFTSFFTNSSFLSEETKADIKLNTSAHFSDERHCKSQQGKSSLVVLHCRETKTQNLDHSRGTHFPTWQRQVSSLSLSDQPSTENILPVEEMLPPSEEQIEDFIAEKVASYRTLLHQKNKNYVHPNSNMGGSFCSNDRDFTSQSDYIMPQANSVAHFSTTSTSDKDVDRQRLNYAVKEQGFAAVGQTTEEDLTELTSKSKETGDCATSASKKHLTGTQASAKGHSEYAPETESAEMSASVDFDLSVKNHLDLTMPTNEGGKLVYSGSYEDETFVGSNDKIFHSKWFDKYRQNDVTTLHFSLTALRELIASLDNVETISEMDNLIKLILQQYWNGDIDNIHLFASTEYPQIMGKVAATCTKNEDESQKILTTVPVMTLDELTEKQPSTSFNCSSSKEEYKFPWLNINKKNLDDTDQMPDVSWALKHITDRKNGDTGLKLVAEVFDSVQDVTDVSEDLQTKSSSVISENKTFEVVANSNQYISSDDKIQVHNTVSIPTKQTEQLCSQTSRKDVSIALSEHKFKEQVPLSESESKKALPLSILKDLQYEDISDDEGVSQLPTKLKNNEKLSFPLCFEDLHYEDISEDENSHNENLDVERPSLTQVPGLNNKQLPFENESCEHVEGQAQMKRGIILDEELILKKQISLETETLDTAQHCFCYCFVESDDGCKGILRPKCERHLGLQPNYSVSCSHSSVLNVEDETGDQMDNDWIVIPISMSDLKFEPRDEDQHGPEKVCLDDGDENGKEESQCNTVPVPASASHQIEVFDTVESLRQAIGLQCKIHRFEMVSDWSTPECEQDPEGEQNSLQNSKELHSEPEDSCETEDSCDYSPEPERHYLTVSRQLLKRRSAPPETDDSVSEKEGQDYEDTDFQKGQTRSSDKSCMQNLRQLINARAACKKVKHKTNEKKNSKMDDVIILDSDTEDETDQNCQKAERRKSGDAPCSQQKRRSTEIVDSPCGTVKGKFKKNRLSFADLPAPQLQCKLHDSQFKEVIQDACTYPPHRAEKSGQQIEAKGDSEHVQHMTNRLTMSNERRNTKRILSSGREDRGRALFATKNRSLTGDHLCGTANQRTKNQRQSSDESQKKLPQSVGNEADILGPNPVIPRLVLKSPQPSKHLKLSKEFRVHMQHDDETWAPETPTGTIKNADSCEKNMQHLYRNEKGRFMSKPKQTANGHHSTKNEIQANIVKPKQVSKQFSLPGQEGPSTSIRPISPPSGQLSEARQSSAFSRGLSQSGETSTSCSPPKSKQRPLISSQHLSSSRLQLSRTYSSPSTLGHPCSPEKYPFSSTTMQLSAKKKVTKDWENSCVPTRSDRKSNLGTEKDLRTTNYDLSREARPGPSHYDRASRQRHNLREIETPLMKKSRSDAKLWRQAINPDASRKQTHSVGDGYKWSEKAAVAKPTKGSDKQKCRTPPRPHL